MVIVTVPPVTKLVVLLGVKVAVTTEVPASRTSNLVPAIAMTEVSAEEYVHVPVADVVATVGETMEMSASPYVALTFVQEKVGMALSTVNVDVVKAPTKLTVSVGVNVAVRTDVPPPVTIAVAVEESIVATETCAEEYVHEPGTAALL
jgi:hypothetical protein